MSVFFDTNVIVYALDRQAGLRHAQADALLAEHMGAGSLVLSTQVLQETYAVLTRKLKASPAQALDVVRTLAEETVVPSSAAFVVEALGLVPQHQLSIWDALIVQAALQARCSVLFSEDLQAGRRFGSLEIVNPFAEGTQSVQLPAAGYRGRRRKGVGGAGTGAKVDADSGGSGSGGRGTPARP